jgi:hypothetical protein
MNYPAAELRSIKMDFYPINPDAEHRGILLIKSNSDGSYDIFFGPKVPEGFENNWLETIIDLKPPTVDHIPQYLFSRNKFPPAYFRT